MRLSTLQAGRPLHRLSLRFFSLSLKHTGECLVSHHSRPICLTRVITLGCTPVTFRECPRGHSLGCKSGEATIAGVPPRYHSSRAGALASLSLSVHDALANAVIEPLDAQRASRRPRTLSGRGQVCMLAQRFSGTSQMEKEKGIQSAAAAATLSRRIQATDEPIIYQMARIIEGSADVMSLGQGVVHWLPPPSALRAAELAVRDPKCSGYGIDDGIPELRAALVDKIRKENGLLDSSIMVTAGANQAFVNVVMAVCDPDDTVVLFQPYYFNHLMAFQMSGVTKVLLGQRDPDTLHPDIGWLKRALSGEYGPIPKVIVITNPDNPTGTFVPKADLMEISALCEVFGTWLVLDNTYEYFMYGGREHCCLEAPHIVNIFSFSKAYGLMGWRVGYIAYPNAAPGLGGALVKAQDTIPICANLVGQNAALAAAMEGQEWVMDRVRKLDANLALARDALSPLGHDAVKGGEGAIYLWARLPSKYQDDRAVVQWLVQRHGVIVIPGSASGAPGHFRISFGNLPEDKYRLAAARLKAGLQELQEKGLVE